MTQSFMEYATRKEIWNQNILSLIIEPAFDTLLWNNKYLTSLSMHLSAFRALEAETYLELGVLFITQNLGTPVF